MRQRFVFFSRTVPIRGARMEAGQHRSTWPFRTPGAGVAGPPPRQSSDGRSYACWWSRALDRAIRIVALDLNRHHCLDIDARDLLGHLKGSELVALGRAASLQHFTFRLPDGGEVFLHTEAPWRLTDSSGIIGGRSDYWRAATPDVTAEALEAGELGCTLRDVRNEAIRARIASRRLEVTSAAMDKLGGLALEFNNDLRLEIFPDASRASHDDWEIWRLFQRNRPHYVVGSEGRDIHA